MDPMEPKESVFTGKIEDFQDRIIRLEILIEENITTLENLLIIVDNILEKY